MIEKGSLRFTGTFTRNTSTIEVSLSGGFDLIYDYTLTNTQLTLDNQGNDQKFIFERP